MGTRNYYSPSGALILGTSDMVSCRAEIVGINEDGTPEYEGDTEVFWDEQHSKERDGKILFMDEVGEEWTFDQLHPEEEEEEEESHG